MNENYMIQTQEIAAKWNDMDPTQQLKFCECCVRKSLRWGRKLIAPYDVEDATQDTFEQVFRAMKDIDKLVETIEDRERQGKNGNTLTGIVSRTAGRVVGRIVYRSSKDDKAIVQALATADSETIDPWPA